MTHAQRSALEVLSVLCQARPAPIKALAEHLIPDLEPITVLKSHTGLVMLPYTDTVQETPFHLGEVMACEVHLVAGGGEGYAVCMGRDLEFATALALIDAALSTGHEREAIYTLADQEAAYQVAQDGQTLRAVATTRVEMETF
jgi:alpha-D-ribose 1-methylphosphonate 5-triphosphate synthase subunit PhnG